MAAGPRHSDPPAPPPTPAEWAAALSPSRERLDCYSTGVRQAVAKRLVHFLLREPPHVTSEEWAELRALASERDSSPVG